MQAELECYYCCINKIDKLLRTYEVEDAEKATIMKQVFLQLGNAQSESAPVLMASTMEIMERQLGVTDSYAQVKRQYNEKLMEKEPQIWANIAESKDPLYAAIQYALIGNYIDFGAMDDVSEKKLEELLEQRTVSIH